MIKPALFLDRDGVINVDHGYVCKADDFHFVEGIFELVAEANRAGYWVVVVTNQAGIGRGYYSEADFHDLTEWMKMRFVEHGAHIDAVYFCPFHPEHGIGEFRKDSNCRKPAPGMLLQAGYDLSIDFEKSILVGDKSSDMAAGQAAGVSTLLHLGGNGKDGCALPIIKLADVLPYIFCAK
jgi:D-glycero-D-manno-heptose 1,7-bisphosphate phosphatase